MVKVSKLPTPLSCLQADTTRLPVNASPSTAITATLSLLPCGFVTRQTSSCTSAVARAFSCSCTCSQTVTIMNANQPLHNRLLTEVLQQRRQDALANNTEATQSIGEPSHSTDTEVEENHPASFSFPTLSPDGSVDDISRPHALLTSLESTAKMAGRDVMSDSTSSLADSQYDMLEDVSSNDEHETASVVSTEHDLSDDGAVTPEDARSIAGDQDNVLADEHETDAAQEIEENAVLDSLLTDDDLETPRQSTLRTPLWAGLTSRRPLFSNPTATVQSSAERTSERALRVLFISERSVLESEKLAICTKITSALTGSDTTSGCRISKLPATPSGISPSSAITFRDGEVELSVQHCIGVRVKKGTVDNSQKYEVHIIDTDGEYGSVFAIGGHLKPDLETPNLAIVYYAHIEGGTAWLDTAKTAMHLLDVPVLSVAAADTDHMFQLRSDYSETELLGASSQVLRNHLDILLGLEISNQARATIQTEEAITTPAATRKQSKRMSWTATLMSLASTLGVLLLLLGLSVHMGMWSGNPIAETAIRREALISALEKMSNGTDVTKSYNLEHLVPQPTPTSTNLLGQVSYDMPYASYYQGAAPNHIVVSLTKKPNNVFYPSPKRVRVTKGGRDIAYNQTKLIEGVFDIKIDSAEAYGLVDVHMLTTSPRMNFSMQHNFGSRILQRKTYEKAGTDISRTVNKDLIVAGKTVRSFKDRVGLEISAGAAATRKMTTELAIYMNRDLQAFRKMTTELAIYMNRDLQAFKSTAASIFDKIRAARSNTTAAIRKDLILFQDDLVSFGSALRTSVSASGQAAKDRVPTKKTVISPLKLASDRAVGFRQKLFGRPKDVNITSATKELSTYFQDFLKSGTTGKKPSKLRDIARCVPARDFDACKKAQATSSSLATIPGKGLRKFDTMETNMKKAA